MGTLKGFVFCALVISLKLVIAESTIYQSPNTVLKFSQCLIDKISESTFFTADDRDSMLAVQDVMAQSMSMKEHTVSSCKILVNAFVSSLAGIILEEDVSRIIHRKGTYSSALEQCSIFSIGYIDKEFIDEAHKILSVIESSKAGAGALNYQSFGSFSNSQASGVGNPIAVQPSPVQNPQLPQFSYPNDKANFEAQKNLNSPPISSSAQTGFNSQYSFQSPNQIAIASSFNSADMGHQQVNQGQAFNVPSASQPSGFPASFAASSHNQNFPVRFDEKGKVQPQGDSLSPHVEKISNDYDTVNPSEIGVPHLENDFSRTQTESFPTDPDTGKISEESSQTGPMYTVASYQASNEGLRIPQTKESSVVVIPPKGNQQPISEETLKQNQEIPAESEKYEFSKTLPGTLPQQQQQFSGVTSYSNFETVIFNILKNSPKFRETFNSQISQEDAINLARDLIERTFAGSDWNVMNDALKVVTEEILKVRVPSPETFAFAISNALAYILKRHDTSLSAKHSQMTSNFLSNLDNGAQFHSKQETTQKHPQDYDTEDTLSQFYTQSETVGIQPQDYGTDHTPGQFYPQQETDQKQLQGHDTDKSLNKYYPQSETVGIQPQDYHTAQTPGEFYPQHKTPERESPDYGTGESLLQSYPQPATFDKKPQDYYNSELVYSDFDSKQRDFDFESPPLAPEDRKYEIFSLSLTEYLIKSEIIRNFFCGENKEEDKVQLFFSIVKASLIDYGQHVSALAASVASGALSELSKEGLCSNYARTMSEIIAEILEENNIKNANAEDVAKKMEQKLTQLQIIPTEPPKPITTFNNTPPKAPKNESYGVNSKMEPFFMPFEDKPFDSDKVKHPDLGTAADFKDDSDTSDNPVTLLYTAILSTAQPNVKSKSSDSKDFYDYLTKEFETLESVFSGKQGDNTEISSETQTTKTGEFEDKVAEDSFAAEYSENESSEKKELTSTSKSETITTSSGEEDEEDYDAIKTVNGYKSLYLLKETGISQKDIRNSNSPESSFQTSPFELQPSFQIPAFDSGYSRTKASENSAVASCNSDYSVAFAKEVAEKAESSINFIRSPNFDIGELCTQINQLAPLANIPKLDKCEPVAAMDYLLNVLRAAVKILS